MAMHHINCPSSPRTQPYALFTANFKSPIVADSIPQVDDATYESIYTLAVRTKKHTCQFKWKKAFIDEKWVQLHMSIVFYETYFLLYQRLGTLGTTYEHIASLQFGATLINLIISEEHKYGTQQDIGGSASAVENAKKMVPGICLLHKTPRPLTL